jgi:hypothetical protein
MITGRHKKILFLFALGTLLLSAGCDQPDSVLPEMRTPFDPDLYAWKTASWTPFTVSDSVRDFVYGAEDGVYVAVSSGGVIAWSDDGDVWERAAVYEDPGAEIPVPFSASYNAVAYGDGRFVAVANGGKAAYSRDGKVWTGVDHITGFGNTNIYGIAWGKAKYISYFVAVGENSNIARSATGATWAGGSASGFLNGSINVQLNDIVYGDGYFYVVGDNGYTGYSDNPGNLEGWKPWRYEDPFHGNNIKKIAFGKYGDENGLALVFEEWGNKRLALGTVKMFTDRAGWDSDLDAGNLGNNYIGGVAFGGGYFVVAGTSAMIGYWPCTNPSDNSNRYWRAMSFPEFQWWEITALAACKDRFFAGGIGGKIGYSK